MTKVLYGVCVSSWDKLTRYVEPRSTHPILALYRQTSIAQAYNVMLNAGRDTGTDVLILQHDDLEITDPAGEAKLIEMALSPSVALVGIAGGGNATLAWWAHDPKGHQMTDARMIDFGVRTGDVEALEGSLLVFSRWAIENLCFDIQYPGFHGYDMDVSRTARSMGQRVVVVDVDTHHHNETGFKSSASHEEWYEADRIYRQKWSME